MRIESIGVALTFSCLSAFAHAQTSGAMLRVACAGEADGALVKVNGVFKGECPVDIAVSEGVVSIEASKREGDFERLFSRALNVANGTVKRVDVVLGKRVLTAEGAAREAERTLQAREREQHETAARLAREKAEQDREVEIAAMVETGLRHEYGSDVPVNAAEALSWYQRAAQAGSDFGAYQAYVMTKRGGRQYSFDETASRLLSAKKTDVRNVNITGRAAVRDFLLNDPFFSVPAGTAPTRINYKFESIGKTVKYVCDVSSGQRYCDAEGVTKIHSTLGGLVTVEMTRLMSESSGADGHAVSIRSVFGKPFPIVPRGIFGFSGELFINGKTLPYSKRCSWAATPTAAGFMSAYCVGTLESDYYYTAYLWRPEYGQFTESWVRNN